MNEISPSLGRNDLEKIQAQLGTTQWMAEIALLNFEERQDIETLTALTVADADLAEMTGRLEDHTAQFVSQTTYYDENGVDTDALDS